MSDKPLTVEEDRDQMRSALIHIRNVLGPTPPTCQGCCAEFFEALDTIKEALGDKA